MVSFSDEQYAVITCPNKKILVPAVAGSGKTTALKGFFNFHAGKEILYIVYNKAMANEAIREIKQRGVTIKTFHGLAYMYIGKYYKDKLVPSYTPMDIISDLGLDRKEYNYAYNLNVLWKQFLVSGCFDIPSFLSDLKFDWGIRENIQRDMNTLFSKKKDLNDPTKISHDFYVFLFHLIKPTMSDYDIIAIDEAQDSSYPIYHLFERFNGIKIAVGDDHQNIYAYRNTINLFKKVKGAITLNLTESFRVSQEIANICMKIYNVGYDYDFKMIGKNPNNVIHKVDPNNQHACICRNNSTIFKRALMYAQQGKSLYFEGGIGGYRFDDYMQFYYFMCGAKPKLAVLKQFKDWQELKLYVDETDDPELTTIIALVQTHNIKLKDMVDLVKSMATGSKKSANVIFSTIHKSKGQTYNIPLIVEEDVLDMCKVQTAKSLISDKKHLEIFKRENLSELNVLYVAITRGKNIIQLPEHLIRFYYGGDVNGE